MTLPIPLLPGSLRPNPGDVANGFYPNIPKVGADDPDFIDIVQWLVAQSGGRLSPVLNVVQDQGRKMPTMVLWVDVATKTQLDSDAAQMFSFPHDTLNDLQKFFSFGNPMVATYYPGYRKPVAFVTVPVLGAPWPEEAEVRGVPCFHSLQNDNLPDGSTYSDGRWSYMKAGRKFAFFTIESVWVKQ